MAVADDTACEFCPDGHEDPRRRRWAAWVNWSGRDPDGQPITITVAKSGGQHVAESDAEWVRALLNPDGSAAQSLRVADDTLTAAELDAIRDAARAVRTWPDWARVDHPAVDFDFIRQALNVDKVCRELRAARTRLAALEAELTEWERAEEPDGSVSLIAVRGAAALMRARLALAGRVGGRR